MRHVSSNVLVICVRDATQFKQGFVNLKSVGIQKVRSQATCLVSLYRFEILDVTLRRQATDNVKSVSPDAAG